MIYTKDIAIKSILKGACNIFKIGKKLVKFTQTELVWAYDNLINIVKGLPIGVHSGSGYGDGYGPGSGYGYGCGSGYGYGCSSGYGRSSGYGDGYGDGCGCGYEIELPQKAAWSAYHYIVRKGEKFVMRNGRTIEVGQVIREEKIKMCYYGLHAGLTKGDARKYRPVGSVLTRVLVWGKIRLQEDKIVATHRKIVGIKEQRNDKDWL